MERFKPAVGYDGYLISDYGRVYSCKTNKFLTQAPNAKGYNRVELCVNGKAKNVSVHRLVAEAFIDNPDNLPIINHKDEEKQNNRADNLEWCTYLYNANYGHCQNKKAERKKRPILQLSKATGEIVRRFDSLKEAEKNGYHHSNVSACCCGRKKSAYGYVWKFVLEV